MQINKVVILLRYACIIILLVSMCNCNDGNVQPERTSPFYDKSDAKLWKHRVNCLANADSISRLFPGIEIDIYYVDSTSSFVCTHGEPCSGASLTSLLSAIDIHNRPYVWLDFKNSDDSLVVAKSIPILKDQLTQLNMLASTIVETKNWQCLDSLNKYKMFSSYWVPHYYDTSPALTSEEMRSTISQAIKHHQPTVLSADYHMFEFLKTQFPDAYLHFWINGLTSDADKATVNKLRAYPNTKVVLVDFDSVF